MASVMSQLSSCSSVVLQQCLFLFMDAEMRHTSGSQTYLDYYPLASKTTFQTLPTNACVSTVDSQPDHLHGSFHGFLGSINCLFGYFRHPFFWIIPLPVQAFAPTFLLDHSTAFWIFHQPFLWICQLQQIYPPIPRNASAHFGSHPGRNGDLIKSILNARNNI